MTGLATGPAGAKPLAETATGLRTGMTWTVLGQQNGYVHVGSDGQTNPYSGDTTVDQYLPALCLQVDGQPAPGGIAFDYYNGWSRGAVRATAAIRGDALTSQAQGDAICASTFGSGWRLAEFHDGWYGADFSAPGGWTFWAAGKLTPGTRFWAAINDQPANPWDSAGELPPPIVVPEDDLALKTRLQELTQPLLTFARNSSFRDLVRNAVARRFDGDDNVLLTDVITEAESAGVVHPNDPAWQSFKNGVAGFQNINGRSYAPQVYIPNYGDGITLGTDVTMTVFESDLSRTALPAYGLDANGELRLRDTPVDEAYSETNEVWVLSPNERVDLGAAELATVRKMDAAGVTENRSTGTFGTTAACNPTGLRNNKGLEYLQRFKVPNPSSVEHWTAGKLEPRMIIVAKDGVELKNAYFGKIKRKTVKNWVNQDLFVTTWDRAQWGDYWVYKWVEIDGGPKVEISLGLGAWIKQLLNVPVTLDVKATFEKKFDDMGTGVVTFTESTYLQYGTGTVDWNVCSVGGEGGTGDDNFARSAIAAASSTFSGYSAARVNDGSRDTRLGGSYSWANNYDAYPPQWVQLDFGTNRTFQRVVVYTSEGYPIRDFDIQVWNGSTWVTPAGGQVRGNTALTVTVNFPAQTSRLVRVNGLLGPLHQQGYVRVNELEVYAQ